MSIRHHLYSGVTYHQVQQKVGVGWTSRDGAGLSLGRPAWGNKSEPLPGAVPAGWGLRGTIQQNQSGLMKFLPVSSNSCLSRRPQVGGNKEFPRR